MDLINIIILFLLLTPFYAVITDFKSGKIKNYFIFPFLFVSFILTFLIEGFYSNLTNIIGLFIIILFGYLFYKDNKWGAGDGKYIILIGLNSLIISYLLGFNINIINNLFISIFGFLLIYNLFFLLQNFNNIKKIKFNNKFNINFLDSFYIVSFIYLLAGILGKYIGSEFIYIIIFLSVILLLPYLRMLKNNYIKYLIISAGVIVSIINSDYISIGLIGGIYIVFIILQSYSEQIFNIIDTYSINLLDVKQGIILTNDSIEKIKKETTLSFSESPLQGDEVFNLIGKYKELGTNPSITIYKDLKIGIIMYIGYFATIIFYI